MGEPSRIERLSAALRAIASRGAATTGGCALLFGEVPGDEVPGASERLRAAAGFADAQEARRSAQAVEKLVAVAIASGEAQKLIGSEALGARGVGDAVILPLAIDGSIRGAFIVAGPGALNEAVRTSVQELATSAAIHLDHAHLRVEVEAGRKIATSSQTLAADKSDELLRLSEELFAQDIQLLRSNEKLGKIEKLKNDFIEKMSLELRTPLNSIIEATISVLAGENDSLSDGAKASLRRALDEGTSFQRTLQNILDLWRIKQGELPVELQEVNFAEVIEEAIFSVQEMLDPKSIRITKNIALPFPKVITDLGKVNQMIFLLLENAAKFTEHGKIEISAHVRDSRLYCSIADTGIGICPDDHQLVFDEFFQVDEFASHKYRGAGLGLTLFRDLLVLLEGDVSLKSEPGHGTTVSFDLPVKLA